MHRPLIHSSTATRTSPTPRLSCTSMPQLDWLDYPHMFDEILHHADASSLAALRPVCRHVKAAAERRLYHHVVVAATYPGLPELQFTPPGLCGLPSNISGLHGLSDDPPHLCAATLERLGQHTRVLDICRHAFDDVNAPASLAHSAFVVAIDGQAGCRSSCERAKSVGRLSRAGSRILGPPTVYRVRDVPGTHGPPPCSDSAGREDSVLL